MATRTVRDAALDVLRERDLTTLFANPGSTEVPFLVGLPDDFEFVLALHESSVVGIATGYALVRSEPAIALLHTAAGLGNAVAAIATARVNRAPLVILVGQQDRRHLAHEPFLAGRLLGLAGDYPVWVEQPIRPQQLPGSISRAWHEATTARGPALVIVPMDDWLEPASDEDEPIAAPDTLVRSAAADPAAVAALAAMLETAERPAIVAGSGADDEVTWAALGEIADKLGAPVWQESFGSRGGFPQDHPRFAGHLPADRTRLRETLGPHDVVLVVGAHAFRQYPYIPGSFAPAGTRVAVLTDEPAEAHRSSAELAVLAPLPATTAELAAVLVARAVEQPEPRTPEPAGARHNPLSPADVFSGLAERLPKDAVILEESPSSRPELLAALSGRAPFGFVSTAAGVLGFALPAAIGIRMGDPRRRPVVAAIGDGSALYSFQGLWSAAHYGVGPLFVILKNGGYAVMDRLAEAQGGGSAWPSFPDIDFCALAGSLGCPARRVTTPDELEATFDEVIPGLGDSDEPLLLEIEVAPSETFQP